MEKFTTILAAAAVLTALGAGPVVADCAADIRSVAARAKQDSDWVRRETILALLAEARRDAARGHEAACLSTLTLARARLTSRG